MVRKSCRCKVSAVQCYSQGEQFVLKRKSFFNEVLFSESDNKVELRKFLEEYSSDLKVFFYEYL